MSAELLLNTTQLIRENARDLAKQDPLDPRNDRLMLNELRIKNISASILNIAKLPDPTGKILDKRTLPNGLALQKSLYHWV